jgi:site-specific recombinase XerD
MPPKKTDLTVVPPSAPLAAMASLIASANAYADASKAKNTRRAYEADWRTFQVWCASKKLESLPATYGTVAVYLAALADAGRKSSTVSRALSGIVYAHRQHGYPWDQGNRHIRDVLAGVRRRPGARIHKKAPVGGEELAVLVGSLDDTTQSGLRDRAILCLGWFGAFRRSELVALDVEDVTFNKEGLVVRVQQSKTDQEGSGESVGVPFADNRDLCAVRAVKAWLDGRTTGPLFCTSTGRRLDDQTIAVIVKRIAKRAGLTQDFAAHSLRSGFATTAAGNGAGLDSIMRQGRWKNAETALGYVRPATLFKNNAAKGLL